MLLEKRQRKGNLSTPQMIGLLNDLLLAALEPVFNHTSMAKQLLLQALLQTQSDHRRKISSIERGFVADLILNGIAANNFNAIRLAELDRSVGFSVLDKIFQQLKAAQKIERKLLAKPKSRSQQAKLLSIAIELGADPNILGVLARWVTPYYKLYREFKAIVMGKYIKLAYGKAMAAQKITGLHVDSKDLFNNYMGAVDRAIDKCSSSCGTLTTYVQNWMLSSRSNPEFDHQYGVAYKIPASIRKQMQNSNIPLTNMASTVEEKHFDIPDDEEHYDKLQELFSANKDLLRLLRHVPYSKVPFLVLDLPIVLNQLEINNLQNNQLVIP
jgi:hypothetical protein